MITMEKVYSRQMAKLKKDGHSEVNRNLPFLSNCGKQDRCLSYRGGKVSLILT